MGLNLTNKEKIEYDKRMYYTSCGIEYEQKQYDEYKERIEKERNK